jgi:tetratricopeptide (TPR) repeat protein
LDFFAILFSNRLCPHDSEKAALAVEWDGLNELAGVQTAITAADAAFLKDMLKFYHEIAQQNANSKDLKLQSGRAYRRVANCYHLIGDWSQAIQAYSEAIGASVSPQR